MTETSNNDNNSEDVQKSCHSKQLVNDIFKKINSNSAIPKPIKEVIFLLQNRYLEIANASPNLFAFENHQARVFLNNVCKISIECAEIEDTNKSFLKKLDYVVKELNQQKEYNNKQFIQFQKILENSLVKLKKRAAVKLKRQKEKQLGQLKITQAKHETNKIISQKLSTLNQPSKYIKNIFTEEWTNVLVLLHIRDGQNSTSYQSKLSFVDLTLEALKSGSSSIDFETKEIYEKYQQGLSLVAFNKLEIEAKVNELKNYFKMINQPRKKAKPVHKITSQNQNTTIKEVKEAKEVKKQVQEEQKKVVNKHVKKKPNVKQSTSKIHSPPKKKAEQLDYDKIVGNLKKGTWIEIREPEKAIKAKLSWVSPITGNHLLVDSKGLKVATKTTNELITGLKDKTIKILKNNN